MKTHEEELKTLLEKHQQEIEKLKIKHAIMNETGLKPLVIHSVLGGKLTLHFVFEGDYKIGENTKILRNIFPPNGEPAKCTFAGKNPIISASPYKVSFDNYDTGSNDVKINWENEKYNISIKFLPSQYPNIYQTSKRLKHLGFGRYQTKRIYSLPTIEGMTSVNYYGDHIVQICTDPEHAANFENYIFTFKDGQP